MFIFKLRSCVLDLLLLAGAVWNTELAGASTFPHYVLCAEGIRLTSAALGTALQHDLDRGVESNKATNPSKPPEHSPIPTAASPPPLNSPSTSPHNNHTTNGTSPTKHTSSDPSIPPYSYEWYDALIIHPKLTTFTSLPIDTINLLQKVTFRALSSSPDHVPKLCRSFHTQLEAFYLMCCSEEFVGQLLLHPVFMEGELLDILQQVLHLWKSPWNKDGKQALTSSGGANTSGSGGGVVGHAFQQNDPIVSVVSQILRVLYLKFGF